MDRETKITLQSIKIKGEDLEKNEGIDFFYKFFQLIKNAYFHNINNVALKAPINNFEEILHKIISKEGFLTFQYKDNTLFFNNNRIKFSSEEFDYAKDVFKFFEERGIGKISFKFPLKEEEILKFLSIFVYSKIRDFNILKREIEKENLPISIEKAKIGEGSFVRVDLDRRLYVFINYSKAIVLVENLLNKDLSESKRNFLISKIYRIIQSFIDICKEDDNTFLGLSQIKNPEKPFPTHIVNVAILAISMAEKMGFSKNKILEIGMASIFYDFGMMEIKEDIREKSGRITPKEGIEIQKHPLYSLNQILSYKNLNESTIYRAIVAFEHHLSKDNEFSYLKDWEEPHIFSKIIKICDTYDSLTTFKPYRPAFLPEEAMKYLLENSSNYDERLVKIFLNLIGIYPTGSFVLLNNGEKGLVLLSGGSRERIIYPIVQILGKGEVVDLKEEKNLKIVSSLPPEKVGYGWQNFFLGEFYG